jgi:hypothetical protein
MTLNEDILLPELQARFAIRALGLNLSSITATLGLQPTSTRQAASRLKLPPIPRVDVWTLEGKRRRSVDGTTAITELVDVLDGVRDKLTEVRSRYTEAMFDLVLVAYVEHPEPVFPDVTLSSELLERIARLGLTFAVSFYAIESTPRMES